MPCLIGCSAYFFPRVMLLILWLLNPAYFAHAYVTWHWPILGFIFMPLTTLAYAFAINSAGSVTGGYAALLVIAALLDLGTHGVGPATRKRRRRRD